MAQNTVVWLLSKGLNDIATSGETPKFDIKWSLPIYDHLTDGTVMTTPYANPGPDMDDGTTPPTHNQKDPGDFNGLFYTNGLKYSLIQWETNGTAGVTETTGWAKNPEWSLSVMERDTSRPAEANTGSNTTFLYGSVSGGTFSGDDYGTNHLSSWSVSNLYENVRYDGTSTEDTAPGEDPRAYAHYTVYLRCEKSEPGVDPTPGFIVGSVRFNKVLLFTEINGAPSPIAMVCLGTPVALFADNQGQSNSLAISFQLGFNPNDTAVENVSFDNLYWTKVGEYPDHEGDMRLFSRNKLVIGELRDALTGNTSNPIISTFGDTNSSVICHSCISDWNGSPKLFGLIEVRPSFNSIEMYQLGARDPDVNPVLGQGFNSLNIIGASNLTDEDARFSAVSSWSLLAINLNENNKIGIGIFNSVAVGGISVISAYQSVIVANTLELKYVPEDTTLTTITSIVNNSLLVGYNNNLSFPVTQATQTVGSALNGDTTMIVGKENKIYGGWDNSSRTAKPSRTCVVGNENVVFNYWNTTGSSRPGVWQYDQAESYVFGTENVVGGEQEISQDDSVTVRNFVLGSRNVMIQAYVNPSPYAPLGIKSNRYILGVENTITFDPTATRMSDVYIFGSNDRLVIDAESNSKCNNKYVFGSNMTVEPWEEYVFGHGTTEVHRQTHHGIGQTRMLSMGVTGTYALGFVIGGEVNLTSGGVTVPWNFMIPTKSTVNAVPDSFKKGQICRSDAPDSDGFYQLYYWFPQN